MEATQTWSKRIAKPLILLLIALFIGGIGWTTISTYHDWYTAQNGTPIQLKVLNDKRVCRLKRKAVLIDHNGPYKIKLYGAKCRKATYVEGQFATFRISKENKVVAEENAYQSRIITAVLLLIGGIIAFIFLAQKTF
jgi:hypothetical protein